MTLLVSMTIQNFKCYRRQQKFDLSQSNFFIGTNNAGKSAVLKALHCFFDDSQYSSDYINMTELRAKGSGFNKTTIGVKFDLDVITTKGLRTKLKNQYGSTVTINKNFTYRENTKTTVIDYLINKRNYTQDTFPPDLSELMSKISVSYIHPQEADELLEKAQGKLKSRLLSNWGRNVYIKETLIQLQTQWTELRKIANSYLSNGLTQNLQNIWPGCSTKVDLPERIEEIIGVSGINFKGAPDLPDVSLTSQGTGAQSTILYQTHFLLDSDRTLHRGFHYPIWLIEEPESFLHADIIFKLGYLLCSDSWLNNIQMLISTHSPLLLATSKLNGDRIKWFSINNHSLLKHELVSNWEDNDITEMGVLMGDPNFDVYFKTAEAKTLIIIEDTKEISIQKYADVGINITQNLNGVAEVKRFFDVLRSVKTNTDRKIYFIIDNDEGFKQFKNSVDFAEDRDALPSGFTCYKFDNNVHLVVFPPNHAMEDLFEEFDSVVESCANQIFNNNYTHATDKMIPPTLSRVHAHIRNKTATGLESAKALIKNTQDVKDVFWQQAADKNWQIRKRFVNDLKKLLLN